MGKENTTIQRGLDVSKFGKQQLFRPVFMFGGIGAFDPGESGEVIDPGELGKQIIFETIEPIEPEDRSILPTYESSIFSDMTEVEINGISFFNSVLNTKDDKARRGELWADHALQMVTNPESNDDYFHGICRMIEAYANAQDQQNTESKNHFYRDANEMLAPHALRNAVKIVYTEHKDRFFQAFSNLKNKNNALNNDTISVRESDIRLKELIEASYTLKENTDKHQEMVRGFVHMAAMTKEERVFLTRLVESSLKHEKKNDKKSNEIREKAYVRALSQLILSDSDEYINFIYAIFSRSTDTEAQEYFKIMQTQGLRLMFEGNNKAINLFDELLQSEKDSDDISRREAAVLFESALDSKMDYGILMADTDYEDKFRLYFQNALKNTTNDRERQIIYRLQQAQAGRIMMTSLIETENGFDNAPNALINYNILASILLEEENEDIISYLLSNLSLNGDIYYRGNDFTKQIFSNLPSINVDIIAHLFDAYYVLRYKNSIMNSQKQTSIFELEFQKAFNLYSSAFWTKSDIDSKIESSRKNVLNETAFQNEENKELLASLETLKKPAYLSRGLLSLFRCTNILQYKMKDGSIKIVPQNSSYSQEEVNTLRIESDRYITWYRQLYELFTYKLDQEFNLKQKVYEEFITQMGKEFAHIRLTDDAIKNKCHESIVERINSENMHERMEKLFLPLGLSIITSYNPQDIHYICARFIRSQLDYFNDHNITDYVWNPKEVMTFMEFLRPEHFDKERYEQTRVENLRELRKKDRGIFPRGITTKVAKDHKFGDNKIATITLSPHRVKMETQQDNKKRYNLDYSQLAVRMRIGSFRVIFRRNHKFEPISADGQSLSLSDDALLYWSTIFSSIERDYVCDKNKKESIRVRQLIVDGEKKYVVVEREEHYRLLPYTQIPSEKQRQRGKTNDSQEDCDVLDIDEENRVTSLWTVSNTDDDKPVVTGGFEGYEDGAIMQKVFNYLEGGFNEELTVIELSQRLVDEGLLADVINKTELKKSSFVEEFTVRLYKALCELERKGLFIARRKTFVSPIYLPLSDLIEKSNEPDTHKIGQITASL